MRYRWITMMMIAIFAITSNADAAKRRNRWHKKSDDKKCEEDQGQSTPVGTGPGYGLPLGAKPDAYSAPARINCTGNWDIFLSGSFIYWNISQEGLGYARFIEAGAAPTSGINIYKFKYKPGFKVAAGTTFGHDDWTGMVEYTRIHAKRNARTVAPPGGTLNSVFWAADQPTALDLHAAKSFWKIDLDVIDGELARWYYSGRMLTLRPFIGPRGGWLDQRIRVSYATVANPSQFFDLDYKSDSWFIGPRTGMDMHWILGYGFRLEGSVAGSLLYQRQKARARLFSSTAPATLARRLRETFRHARPNAELGMGIGWGAYLMKRSWHIDFLAAYEFHYWWNQNVLNVLAVENSAPLTYTTPGDLIYHGLTATFKLDF